MLHRSALDRDGDSVAGVDRAQDREITVAIRDGFACDVQDAIAFLQAGAGGGAFFQDADHEHAAFEIAEAGHETEIGIGLAGGWGNQDERDVLLFARAFDNQLEFVAGFQGAGQH